MIALGTEELLHGGLDAEHALCALTHTGMVDVAHGWVGGLLGQVARGVDEEHVHVLVDGGGHVEPVVRLGIVYRRPELLDTRQSPNALGQRLQLGICGIIVVPRAGCQD